MKKPYDVVMRAVGESTAVIEQFCQANGEMLLPMINLIQSARQVVETARRAAGLRTTLCFRLIVRRRAIEADPTVTRPGRSLAGSADILLGETSASRCIDVI